MNKQYLFACFLLISFTLAVSSTTKAQSTITFKVNMKSQLTDSTFIESSDQVVLTGNQFPLNPTKTVKLVDKAPADSIYQTSIEFSRSKEGKQLRYNFILKRTGKDDIKESYKRSLKILGKDVEVGPILFNSYRR